MLPMAPDQHVLEFSNEGYASASTPVGVATKTPAGAVGMELMPLTLLSAGPARCNGACRGPGLDEHSGSKHQYKRQPHETRPQPSRAHRFGQTPTPRHAPSPTLRELRRGFGRAHGAKKRHRLCRLPESALTAIAEMPVRPFDPAVS